MLLDVLGGGGAPTQAPFVLGGGLSLVNVQGLGQHNTAGPSTSSIGPRPKASEDSNQVCTFFLRTGLCAYADRCKFKHPLDRLPPSLNTRGYPMRQEAPDCAHYLKKGWCAFGATCRFNHPELGVGPMMAAPRIPMARPVAMQLSQQTPGTAMFSPMTMTTLNSYPAKAGVYPPAGVQGGVATMQLQGSSFPALYAAGHQGQQTVQMPVGLPMSMQYPMHGATMVYIPAPTAMASMTMAATGTSAMPGMHAQMQPASLSSAGAGASFLTPSQHNALYRPGGGMM